MAAPIIPNLIQDMTRVIYQHVDGLTRYRLSMVSKDWHTFCNSNIIPIITEKDTKIAIETLDIIRILKGMNSVLHYDMMYHTCINGNVELLNIIIKKGNTDWSAICLILFICIL